MTTTPTESGPQPRRRSKRQQDSTHLDEEEMPHRLGALTTSLESIEILPRTPRTPRRSRAGRRTEDDEPVDEVELSLLGEDERRDAAADLTLQEEREYLSLAGGKRPISSRDKRAMVLLIVLYLIQGFPLGLALGSVPFILREHLSYSEIAVFSLSGYPYSLKLLWSPIVDSLFLPSIGRRKSWIIPMQLIIGTIMLVMSFHAEDLMSNPGEHLYTLCAAFTSLVLFSATQDIAVDGWALTLLSEENLPYASTCQTIGLNTGYLMSYTVFLALNGEDFAKKWGIPRLTLSAYLLFCGAMSYAVTIWLIFKKEDKEVTEEDISIKAVYLTMWNICKLKHVQILLLVHLFAKIGWQANDAVTQLKMVEKGLNREDLAITVLIDFPFQIVGGWLAGRWSRGDKPLRAWIHSYWPRLVLTLISTLMVYWFPKPPISTWFFLLLIVQTVMQSFAGTIQFGGMSAFHTRISDPVVGGTYMTLLNTFTNLGGTWPKFFVLKGVDLFSVATCNIKEVGQELSVKASECVSEHGKAACTELGGECITEQDGYYIVSAICLGFGLLSVLFFLIPTARKLQAVPSFAALHRTPTATLSSQDLFCTQVDAHEGLFAPCSLSSFDNLAGTPGASSYSALVTPASAPSPDKRDDTHPFRYTKEEMLRIYKEGGGRGGLGLEVERWDGIVREVGYDPVGLKDMGEAEKKMFAGSLNSEVRRRPSTDFPSHLNTSALGDRQKLSHANSGAGSPMRERFIGRRRDPTDPPQLTIPRKASLSSMQGLGSPGLPSPRNRMGITPGFDGVLSDTWSARRRASENVLRPGAAPRNDRDLESDPKGPDIKEEVEEEANTLAQQQNADLDPATALKPQVDRGSANGVNEHPGDAPTEGLTGSMANLNLSKQPENAAPTASIPLNPPPGLGDLASVEWSYLDPQGHMQGPFRADVMQRWYNDGYFTPELHMKRTHLDTDWTPVSELILRAGTQPIFLTPLFSSVPPPGLARRPDLVPERSVPQREQSLPYQPVPTRTLRSSTLDSYLQNGSTTSNSPTSSFGAGRFLNGSPDPATLDGRVGSHMYPEQNAGSRLAGYTGAESSIGIPGQRRFTETFDQSFPARPYGNLAPGRSASIDGLGFSGLDSINAGPADSSGPFSPVFGTPGQDLASAANFGKISLVNGGRALQIMDPLAALQANLLCLVGIGGSFVNGSGSPYSTNDRQAATPSAQIPIQQLQQSFVQTPIYAGSQSPWHTPDTQSFRRAGPFDPSHPTSNNTIIAMPLSPSQPSSYGRAAPNVIANDQSPWFTASQGVHNEQHRQQEVQHVVHKSPDVSLYKGAVPVILEEPQHNLLSGSVPAPTPSTETIRPPKVRRKSSGQVASVQPKVVPAKPPSPSSPVESKPAWVIDDDSKKNKPSGVTLGLREIQEAETKKLEARKIAERERERATRAAAGAAAPQAEDFQPFTASFIAVRYHHPDHAGVDEHSEASGHEEDHEGDSEREERRKKQAVKEKETMAATARRAYAETTTKSATPAQPSGSAWTTVGSSGKTSAAAAAAAARPAIPSSTSAKAVPGAAATVVASPSASARPPASTSRPSVPAVVALKVTPSKTDDTPASPSLEFLKWLSDSLKGLNSSVNLEEITSMLLSFPLDPDPSTLEIISDLVYASSTTLDGRRFASEFVSRRKVDATSRPKGMASSSAPGKPLSIAEVVKAQPKPTQSEWGGFKVVNKKKKGGRA
ncbi:hypothetical protein A0H81_00307 [Grifola frondosa]|uniref:GYF domain-containing protein n=1 Tax=Grifola frondosa TaxID=5627 RepID=A0A1C7MVD1_GRIFR|nr:hypothetical protein A0H81_00307 [Grifola frondosa]